MKVNSIQPNYSSKSNVPKKKQAQVQFKGRIGDMITDSLKHKNVLKWMKNLEWLKGETGGILLTAIGTGCVAPWFIAFNPFVKAPKGASKEEKKEVQNTKMYTAMRQIVSMVLAIIIQLGILIPIDKFLDSMINKKEFAKNFREDFDQSELNTKKFIESRVKEELKREGQTKPSFWQRFKLGSKAYKEKVEAYEQLVKSRVETAQNDQIKKIAEKFRETGKINVGSTHIKFSSVAELINSQIEDYIADAKSLQINEKGIEFYSKRAKTLMSNENHLREIFKNSPKDAGGLKTFLNNLLSTESKPEIKELIKEIIELPDAELQSSRITRTLARIQKIKEACGGTYSEQTYLEAMKKRNSALEEIINKLTSKKVSDVNAATQESIQSLIEEIKNICKFDKNNTFLNDILHDTDTFNHDAESLVKKIYKDIAKKYKKFVENQYKSFNQPLKVLIGVFITLPITCNLLNWIYPRFMEVCFPKLAGVKKAKEGGNK